MTDYQKNIDVNSSSTANSVKIAVRATLRRYAFVFTMIGLAITAINFSINWYLRTIDEVSKLSTDAVLYESQFYLRTHSDGGTDYKFSSQLDQRFNISLENLFNFYETASYSANRWLLIKPVFASNIKCSLAKHVEIFLLGEKRPKRDDLWLTDGQFIDPISLPETIKQYKYMESDLDKCIPVWRIAAEAAKKAKLK